MLPPAKPSQEELHFLLSVSKSVHLSQLWLRGLRLCPAAHICLPGRACFLGAQGTDSLQAPAAGPSRSAPWPSLLLPGQPQPTEHSLCAGTEHLPLSWLLFPKGLLIGYSFFSSWSLFLPPLALNSCIYSFIPQIFLEAHHPQCPPSTAQCQGCSLPAAPTASYLSAFANPCLPHPNQTQQFHVLWPLHSWAHAFLALGIPSLIP